MDAFELYFRQADADGDGRITGPEAVSFFKATGLPQITLAKIWQFSDQAQRGFLSKPEFFYALKLVTIAQSGKDLTPEIARAALTVPAATQIPAPRIVQGPAAVPQSPQYRAPLQGARGSFTGQQGLPVGTPGQPPTPTQPIQQRAFGAEQWKPQPPQPVQPPTSGNLQNSSQDRFGVTAFQAAPDPFKPPPVSSITSTLGNSASSTANATTTALALDVFGADAFKASTPAPSRPALPDSYGSGTFSAKPPTSNQDVTDFSAFGAESAIVPAASVSAGLAPSSQTFSSPVHTGHMPPAQNFVPPAVQALQPTASAPGVTWPKMSQADMHRYSQVFAEVDTDRDGKIRGEQARDLFLSWRLPRDVLKQIWDLSDQDGDSMLSLREFCIALYFMERYREGRPVPPVLPAGFLPEIPLSQTLQPAPVRPPVFPPQQAAGVGGPVWPQSISPGVLPGSEAVGLMPVQASPMDTGTQSVQYKSRVPPLEIELVGQLNRDDQDTLKSKFKEAAEADKKVFELDKDIKDATEKIEFYRAKLQEIILFKTRTDNHLLEITERLASDKREVDALRRRYDLKFQQAGESNSRLLADEAAFRDIQQRKMELYNGIAKIEQGGNKDETLQDCAERISADLNELKTLVNQRAKKLGLRAKPSSPMEFPFGWQPGIQENAVDWDDWDKFDDEGFVYFQEVEEAKSESTALRSSDPEKLENGPTNGKLESSAGEENLSTEAFGERSEESNEKVLVQSPHDERAPEPRSNQNEEKRVNGTASSPSADPPLWTSAFSNDADTDMRASWGLNVTAQDAGNASNVEKGKTADFGDFLGLKSIKTSVLRRAGDESVPETPLFKAVSSPAKGFDQQSSSSRQGYDSVPGTPLFKTVAPGDQQSSSSRAGYDFVPETPLFKTVAPGDQQSSSQGASFDNFSSFNDYEQHEKTGTGIFNDGSMLASSSPFGVSEQGSDHWSTF